MKLNYEVVVKIQRSLNSTTEQPQMLIYNQDHSIQWQDDLHPKIERLLGGRLKCFALGHVDDKGVLAILGETPEQTW